MTLPPASAPLDAAGPFALSTSPRIADYAFLSDCHTGALVAPDGSVEWMCLPRFHSASLFGAILDRDAGFFRVGPRTRVPLDRRYEPGTNVLETTWATPTGWLEVCDGLAIGPWHEDDADPHRRPPADHEADHQLIRLIECQQGEVEVEITCAPVADYGREPVDWTASGRHEARTTLGELELRLTSDLELDVEDHRVVSRHRLMDGEVRFCALSWSGECEPPASAAEAQERLGRTSDYWRRWLQDGHFPDHPWRIHLQRSALTLKGLTYAPTGALVAAPTTSLPESPGGERNWDYRYSWIRDGTFALWSMHVLGFDWEAADFAQFVADVCHESSLQIMYGIEGEKELTERTLDHLRGYLRSQPVRVGNAAYAQRQNDVYGALLDAIYIHAKTGDRLSPQVWDVAREQVETAARVWTQPDQGIWETRGEPKHYFSSKLMCWVALDRGVRLARWRDEAALAARWGEVAEAIRADILERGVSERGVFRQHYETDALDAATLLVPLVRFLPPDDDRVRATAMAIADELTVNGLVMRYRPEETDDGLRGEEGSFTMCSFWLASAFSEIGEPDRARALCERLLGLAGPLGLYGEELEPRSGAHLGNFPQAFTHLSLINAVTHVIADEIEERPPGAPTAVFGEMRARRGRLTRRAGS